MYEKLIKKIEKLLANQATVVVAISGHGGSGKSTLADKLASEFGVEDNQIIRLDNLHAKNYEHAVGLFEISDWPVILELLSNIRTSKRLVYKTRSWREVEGTIDIPKPRLIIVEGVRLLRTETQPLFDLSIWIDCPLTIASKRAKERNRLQGDSEAELALWDSKWIPESRSYVQNFHPEKIADIIYKDFLASS